MASDAAWKLIARRPGSNGAKALVEPLGFEWLALAGLFAFAGWLLGVQGVWGLLLRSDPTGITLVIIVVFSLSTLWCGMRACGHASSPVSAAPSPRARPAGAATTGLPSTPHPATNRRTRRAFSEVALR